MDDFINKTGFGLNASFSNGIGIQERIGSCGMVASTSETKGIPRASYIAEPGWYKAYPGHSAVDLERNTRIRHGLEMSSITDEQAREWIALL